MEPRIRSINNNSVLPNESYEDWRKRTGIITPAVMVPDPRGGGGQVDFAMAEYLKQQGIGAVVRPHTITSEGRRTLITPPSKASVLPFRSSPRMSIVQPRPSRQITSPNRLARFALSTTLNEPIKYRRSLNTANPLGLVTLAQQALKSPFH